jgi:signal peptidase
MTRVLRFLGSAALWVVAVVGVLTGAVWIATTAGWIQPLVVTSGSMEPGIETGDLIVATPRPASEFKIGDVATLRSSLTGSLVTHRIVAIELDDDQVYVTMRGDANEVNDPEPYAVGISEEILTPWVIAPGLGTIMTNLSKVSVIVPALIALGALLALSLLPSRKPAVNAEPVFSNAEGGER